MLFGTAAIGSAAIGLFALYQRRRRRQRHRAPQAASADASQQTERAGAAVAPAARPSRPVVRIRASVPFLRMIFELLLFIIAMCLAWVLSGDQHNMILHTVLIWTALRVVGVAPPQSVIDDADDNADEPSSPALVHSPGQAGPSPTSPVPSAPSNPVPSVFDRIDGDPNSKQSLVFLGHPPPIGSEFSWLDPLSVEMSYSLAHVVRHFWTFYGSAQMPAVQAELVSSGSTEAGEQLIRRMIRFPVNPPYMMKSLLADVADVIADERSVWNPADASLCVYSRNVSSREYVCVMELCEIRQSPTRLDHTVITRRGCFFVHERVGIIRGPLQVLIGNIFAKKGREIIDKFKLYLANVASLTRDPIDTPGTTLAIDVNARTDRIGEPSPPESG